jgi:integrase
VGLLLFYRVVLGIQSPWMEGMERAKRPTRLPTVLSQDEARCLLVPMEGRPQLLASLLYGTGMRLMELLRLRVKNVDFARNKITIYGGKGAKDRHTVLLTSLIEPLQREIERTRNLHAADLAAGFGAAALPYAMARNSPSAACDFG